MAQRILLIEDETIMLTLLSTFLEKAGYRVTGAMNAAEGLASFDKETPDLVILDLVLPDEDGTVVLRKLRMISNLPIVVLSGRADNEQRTVALELGANDFVNKGVDPQELVLRIRNALGNAPQNTATDSPPDAPAITFSGWTLDISSRVLLNAEQEEIHLTRAEYQLLAALAKTPGNVVKRDALVDAVSGIENGPSERSLDTYMNRLRKKVERDPKNPEIIITLKGVGYRLRRDPV